MPGRVDLRCPLVVGGVETLQPGRRKPAAFSAPSAASRVTRLRGQKWLSKGACSHSQPQSSTQERRKTAGPPQKPPWIHRQGPSAWCGTGGATARSPRRLQKSLTSKHAKSMQILSHCDQICIDLAWFDVRLFRNRRGLLAVVPPVLHHADGPCRWIQGGFGGDPAVLRRSWVDD